MHFRKATESDIERIMEIVADGREAIRALGLDQWQGGYPHRGVIEGDVARGDSYLVEDENGCVVATAMVGFSGERDYDRIEQGAWLTSCTSEDPCYGVVHRVATAAESRGRGAAVFVMAGAEQLARERGAASVRVDTHPGNAPMQRLLERCGYSKCGIIFIGHAEGATPERIAYEKLV
ncbi:GNAT family N-acetyltransferase [Gordonibacter sp. An230]|uniref:GNAT family N-acetyltransferase n=1 Tax=Gordonibacter sp. An230 TaxID=1965592 RepID=UPI000B57101B|nr:GNAT family N-acetyltransferase [Gordonibacter sp. An230]OUO90767.1 GNAT family N-acetyltransferase [Gordonibacter sp. An230]